MTTPAGRIHEMEHHTADWATTRPVVSGTQGVVTAGHPLVAMAGMRMLMAGGNAFDAAVAAGFAATVVEPTASYTLCGECVAMVYDARRGETRALSGQGTAPALATIPFFRERGLDRIPTGPGADAHLSFTVPGAVDAFLTLLETHGTRTVSEVLAPGGALRRARLPHVRIHAPDARDGGDAGPVRCLSAGRPRRVLPGRPRAAGGRALHPARAGGYAAAARGGGHAGARPPRCGDRGRADPLLSGGRGGHDRRLLRAAGRAPARRGPGRLSRAVRRAGADHLRRARDPGPVGVDTGARAPAGPRHARHAGTCARSATTPQPISTR